MYQVTCEIDFCYGHRLLDYDGKCKHLHGHNGRAVVTIESAELDARGMVFDFSEVPFIDVSIAMAVDQLIVAAQEAGLFVTEITPVSVPQRRGDPVEVVVDEEPTRSDPSKFGKLRPAFDRKAGTVTAANASTINW